MWVKLSSEDLNFISCLLYPTSTYTYRVIIVPKMSGNRKF